MRHSVRSWSSNARSGASPARQIVVNGLLARIEWSVRHERPREETAQVVDILTQTLEKFATEDFLDAFYAELAARFGELPAQSA